MPSKRMASGLWAETEKKQKNKMNNR